MKEFKRSSVTEITPISRTTAEKKAYQEAMVVFEAEMRNVRADSISKSTHSQLAAAKTILNT